MSKKIRNIVLAGLISTLAYAPSYANELKIQKI